VGISDHTLGIGVALAGVALGASIIEKHFVLSRDAGGIDAAFSLEPAELMMLVNESKTVALAVGQILYGGASSEQDAKKYRRSIYIAKNIKKGEMLTSKNTQIIRPGFGLAPKFHPLILGQQIIKDAIKGTPLSWDLLKK
jgi:N-acetylneuraminate synthase